ncbi:hypothetical protein T4D_12981 [Trichinella pseudospiralis]|uniref:Uncharacterized protein n=1 Tax=Trichinella pseudospiralis TaxID=6337 RepID=A0A0V1G5R7_TRIPS|nr:hypothetical protein T4D_12981 [Trichinella pseudospiralis]
MRLLSQTFWKETKDDALTSGCEPLLYDMECKMQTLMEINKFEQACKTKSQMFLKSQKIYNKSKSSLFTKQFFYVDVWTAIM